MLRIIVLLALLSFSSVVGKADQITTGVYSIGRTGALATVALNFSGQSFSVTASATGSMGVSSPAMGLCDIPCGPGTVINLSSNVFLTPSDFVFGGVVTVNGVSYPVQVGGSGLTNQMSFAAGSVVIPETTDSTIVLSTSFVLTSGSIVGPGYGVGFTYTQGIANLFLRKTGTDAQGNSVFVFERESYNFAATPTPEPATMLLLGSGLVGIAAKVRKRRKAV